MIIIIIKSSSWWSKKLSSKNIKMLASVDENPPCGGAPVTKPLAIVAFENHGEFDQVRKERPQNPQVIGLCMFEMFVF